MDLSAVPEKQVGPGVWNKAAVKNIDDPKMHIHNGTDVPQTFVLGQYPRCSCREILAV